MQKLLNKKGLTMSDAPSIVMVVGFVFLIMATLAYVGEKYQSSMPDTPYTVANETSAKATHNNVTGFYVGNAGQCNFGTLVITRIQNASSGVIVPATNYTYTEKGLVLTSPSLVDTLNNSAWNTTYTYTHSGTACNITRELGTNLSDNTDIAGILLTIGLVGIILGVLIGVFAGFRGQNM